MKTIRSYRLWIFPINLARVTTVLMIAGLVIYDAKSHHSIAAAIAHYLVSLGEIK